MTGGRWPKRFLFCLKRFSYNFQVGNFFFRRSLWKWHKWIPKHRLFKLLLSLITTKSNDYGVTSARETKSRKDSAPLDQENWKSLFRLWCSLWIMHQWKTQLKRDILIPSCPSSICFQFSKLPQSLCLFKYNKTVINEAIYSIALNKRHSFYDN